MKRYLKGLGLGLLVCTTVALAAAIDNTSSSYKPTNGAAGSVSGVVIQQSDNAYNALPINSAHPLPITGTVTVVPGGPQTVQGGSSDNTANSTAKLPVIGGRANAADQTWTEGNMVPFSTDLAGYQRVTAKQSGTWNVNNISGTISLPTGASTAALQSVVQSAAGTPNATAITVQGNASGIPFQVQGNVASDVAVTANPLLSGGRASSSTPAAVTAGNAVAAWMNLRGATVVSAGANTTPADARTNAQVELRNLTEATTAPLATLGYVYNGATLDRIYGNTAGQFMQGNVASDATVTANPLLMGGRAANTLPSAVSADGDAVAATFTRDGALVIAGASGGTTRVLQTDSSGYLVGSYGTTNPADGVSNSGFVHSGLIVPGGIAGHKDPVAGWVFNGSTWDRMRGSTTGLFAQGNVASDAAVSSNPLLDGGRASNTLPAAVSTDGDAVAAWKTLTGAQVMAGFDSTNPQLLRTDTTGRVGITTTATPADAAVNGDTAVAIVVRPSVYNGSGWDRLRGNTLGSFMQGNVASDVPVTANPLLAGALGSQAAPTAVSTNGDAVALWATRNGSLVTTPNSLGQVLGDGLSTTQYYPLDQQNANIITQVTLPLVFNGTNYDRTRTASGDGLAATGLVAAAGVAWNGSTWDRLRGTTNGLQVIGAAAQGATAAGAPVLEGGVYTSNANQPAVTTGQVATLQTDPAGNLRTAPQRPAAADILSGSATVTATTGTTALVTVPAARTVVGDLCINVAGSKAAAATGNGEVLGTALTAGTSVNPAAGTYFEVDTAIGANAATGTVGTDGSDHNCTKWTQVSPAGNSTTLNYVTTCTSTTACRISVSFNGVLQ